MNTLVTGGKGMLGSHIGYGLKPSIDELNLLNYKDLLYYIRENNITNVIHCAAKVGGLKYNIDHNADMIMENVEMNNNVLKASIECDVKKIVSVLSTCVFPADTTQPFHYENIHQGFPHISNYGYAYAKRMLLVSSLAIRNQYGLDCMTIIPSNMFGARDNFILDECHVIPALIRKAYESTDGNLVVGGTGIARREFLYAKDGARVIEWMMENYDNEEPLIVSPATDISILEVAEIIANRFDLDICFDQSFPDGQLTRRSDSSLFDSLGTGIELTNFYDALHETIDWFILNVDKLYTCGRMKA